MQRLAQRDGDLLIVALDPGVSAVGIAACCVNLNSVRQLKYKEWRKELKWCLYETVNLIQLVDQCDRQCCSLRHTGQFVDRVDHLIQCFPILERADFIIVESQPPMGFTEFQNLIMKHFETERHKIILIEPRSRNKWAQFTRDSTRMDRKRQAVQILLQQWGYFPVRAAFSSYEQFLLLLHVSGGKSFAEFTPQEFAALVDLVHDRVDGALLVEMFIEMQLLTASITNANAEQNPALGRNTDCDSESICVEPDEVSLEAFFAPFHFVKKLR